MNRSATMTRSWPGRLKLLALLLAGTCRLAHTQVTYTVTTTDDSFLATGSPTNPKGTNFTAANFGAAGMLAIAPASSVDGEFQTVLKFDLAGAATLFSSTYGTNWLISGISLEFASNFGADGAHPDNTIFNTVTGGDFVVEWLANDNWSEGAGKPNMAATNGVTYNSLPSLLAMAHEILCTNTYLPPGNNVHVTYPLPSKTNLVNDIRAGGAVSFRLYAADDQVGYLFNSHNFGNGNEPLIHVTAIPNLRILSSSFTNGLFHLAGMGGTNAVYQIQASDDLSTTNWQTLGTAVADGAGLIEFDDPAPNPRQRFYRISN